MIRRKIGAFVAGVSLLTPALVGIATPAQAAPSPAIAADKDASDPSAGGTTATPRPPKPTKKDVRLTRPYTTGVKYRPPARPGTPTILVGTSRDYAVASLALSNQGADANVQNVNPFVTNTDLTGTHSLAEVSVSSTTQLEIAEVGWRKTAADAAPKIFVYSWVNGVGQGYGTNFTLWAGRTYSPGDTITTGSAAKYGLFYDSTTPCGTGGNTGAWWANYANTWMGYYCDQNFTAATGMNTGTADFDQWFFEYAYDTTRGFFCGDMGSGSQGSLGAAGLPDIGFFGSMRMFGQPTTNPPFTPYIRTIPTAATHITVYAASARTYYGGGPGKNSTGTAVGTKGSC